jgi:hypothetical protein
MTAMARRIAFSSLVLALVASASPALADNCTGNAWQPTFVHDRENEDGPWFVFPRGGFKKLEGARQEEWSREACKLINKFGLRDARGFTTCEDYTRVQCGCSRADTSNATCAQFLGGRRSSPLGASASGGSGGTVYSSGPKGSRSGSGAGGTVSSTSGGAQGFGVWAYKIGVDERSCNIHYVVAAIAGNRFDRDPSYTLVAMADSWAEASEIQSFYAPEFDDQPDGIVKLEPCHPSTDVLRDDPRARAGLAARGGHRPGAIGPLEWGINRYGSDYRHFEMATEDPGQCRSACASEATCRAFTYVKPGIQGPSPVCWLKDSVPDPTPSECCVSGMREDANNRAEGAGGGIGEGVIEVIAGTYGGNCGVSYANVTSPLASACNGREECDYTIDYQVIGDPSFGCAKDYVAEWRCSNGSQAYSARAEPEAGYRKVVSLSCR